MIKIDKNIPIPQKLRKAKYPWADMEVGDSFLVEGVSKFHGIWSANKKFKPKHFISEVNPVGVRVWRDE